MRSFILIGASALVLAAAWLLVGCEDTGNIAPSDSQVVVTANPETVIIDTVADPPQTEGLSTIMAQLFDSAGFPLSGVNVTFSTSGGTLASAPADPGDPPTTLETDQNGIARDLLTLSLSDSAPVTVTMRSGTLTGSVSVDKVVDSGNIEPEAIIVANPSNPDQARAGRPVTFDGRSSGDPDGEITCYKWTIEPTEVTENRRFVQGPSKSLIAGEAFLGATAASPNPNAPPDPAPVETLTVVLKVSDDANPGCDTCNSIEECGCEGIQDLERCGASDAVFSAESQDFLVYEIVCDTTDPLAFATGPTTPQVLSGGSVSVDLFDDNSRDTDPGIDIVWYRWECKNNGSTIIEGPDETDVTCDYEIAGTKRPTLTVYNECGRTGATTVQVTVQAAP